MRAVDLRPRDAHASSEGNRRVPIAIAACGFVVLGLSVVMYHSASAAVDARTSDLALTQAAIDGLPAPERPTVSSSAVVQERVDRTAALSGALDTRVPFDRLLRDLSYVLPDDAWLTGLSASAPVDTASATAPGTVSASTTTQGVTIAGATFSQASVARVLSRLSALASLTDVRLATSARVEPVEQGSPSSNSTKSKRRQKTVVTFTIGATLRGGSGS